MGASTGQEETNAQQQDQLSADQQKLQQQGITDTSQVTGSGTPGASLGANKNATSPNKFILTPDYIQQSELGASAYVQSSPLSHTLRHVVSLLSMKTICLK